MRPEFVDHLPEQLEEGVLYISEGFAIAGHKCCCGCGEEVITPLNHAQWQLSQKSGFVTLYPSIGNWKFLCKSHYWIRNNRVIDSPSMGEGRIKLVAQRDRRDKDRYIQKINASSDPMKDSASVEPAVDDNKCQSEGISKAIRWIKTFLRTL
jgi:hypothetical protein